MTYTYYSCLHVDRKKTRFKIQEESVVLQYNGNKGLTYMYR